MGIPQPGGPPIAVRTAWDLRFGSQLDSRFGPAPDGEAADGAAADGGPEQPGDYPLRQQAPLALGKAALFAGLGSWFGDRAWRLANEDARVALAVVWAVALASAVWYGWRQRRAFLADPWGYLVRSRRAARSIRRRGLSGLSGLPAEPAGAWGLASGTSSYLALTRQRVVGTGRRLRRYAPTHHGRGSGLSVWAYLAGSALIVGMCTPAFIDPSMSPMDLAWSTCGVFFVPVLLLQAIAFWQCRTGGSAAGPEAQQPALGSAGLSEGTGRSSQVSLGKAENLS